jgi:hypothetical protein
MLQLELVSSALIQSVVIYKGPSISTMVYDGGISSNEVATSFSHGSLTLQ